ncbi:hypothetical protein H0G86_004866 [Trichoderma simmonsii]|uniref:Uncharacterized protein n=1 Tax=Trichoderma simmonsii TaxID=1491479 RepID=A0A8G0LBB3_9HYPO|nr:hypothetical protein H0G86_004866 [Trichoderma simmonsii]
MYSLLQGTLSLAVPIRAGQGYEATPHHPFCPGFVSSQHMAWYGDGFAFETRAGPVLGTRSERSKNEGAGMQETECDHPLSVRCMYMQLVGLSLECAAVASV